MKDKNKIELLNALLKAGGHDRSITIKNQDPHVGIGFVTVQVDLSFSQGIEIDLGDVFTDGMFADLFDNETIYELSGKIAKILEDTTISDAIDTGTKKSDKEYKINEEINKMYKKVIDNNSDQIYNMAWEEFWNGYVEGYSTNVREDASMDFYDENYEHGFHIEVNPVVKEVK
tara:strand:- start:3706 stop:4224 length:519 start_codon:yes stop_codon:yes gene_type:complete